MNLLLHFMRGKLKNLAPELLQACLFPDEGVHGKLLSSDRFPQDCVMLSFFLPWLLLHEIVMRLSCLQVYSEG